MTCNTAIGTMSDVLRHPPQTSFELLNAKIGHVLPETIEDFILEVDKDVIGEALLSQFNQTKKCLYDGNFIVCKTLSQMLLDITWEQLNTGHWSDVNITWRHTFSYASVTKAFSILALIEGNSNAPDVSLKDAMKTCDLGLLMGAPVMDNILSKLICHLQKLFHCETEHVSVSGTKTSVNKIIKIPQISRQHALPRLETPSLESFSKNSFVKSQPVIIEGTIDFWPALSTRKWSLSYLRSVAGLRTVPVELGSKYTEESWSQALMTMDDFIIKHVENASESQIGYLAQHQLFDQIPELRKDIVIPDYCSLGHKDEVDINAWFGPCGTISPLHQDPKHNFLAQVVGEKYIRLYAVKDTESVYPYTEKLLSNTSQVDVENPDLQKFPKFSHAPYWECILKPGEMLYIPPKVWHYVRALDISFSVSFWWE